VPLSIVLALLVAALPARVAQADTPPATEDQSFIAPTNDGINIGAVPFMYVAQTFTVGTTGALHAISIDMASTSYGGELQIALRGVTNGVPNDTMLAYVLLTEDDLRTMSAAPLSYMIPMPDLFVTAGEQLAIEVNYISYSNMAPPPNSLWSGATGNLYAGGSVFRGSDGTYTDWQPVSDPGLDLHFRTFVITGVPVSDLTVKRVRGADKASACRQFSEIYTITNNGPDTAEHVLLHPGITDQFDLVSLGAFPNGGSGPFRLAPGESIQFKAVFKVTAFVPGESREGRVSATAFNDSWPDYTIDPNPGNDTIENIVWLQGQPRTGCK
jgi:hypothetical protein